MKRLTSYICAAAMAVSTVGLGTMSANAQPVPAPTSINQSATQSNVIQVQRSRDRSERRHARDRRGFERRGDRAYYRGYRGSRQARAGWRRHQGWWFPPAAFAMGAIIGGAIGQAQPAPVPRRGTPPRRGLTQAHVEWCYNRYRSYRSSDNTFQPYQGPRRECRSPYMG
jgi:Ni/Co efflux regulator RcnB